MGEDFDFKEWCDSWLLTSGSNQLHPIVEYGQNNSIKSLSVVQTVTQFGNNRLRKQKIDIAIYDPDYRLTIIKGLVLSDKKALNKLDLSLNGTVEAVILNHGDHAYSTVFYDPHTLANLETNLYKIDDYLTRLGVIQNLWYHVMEQKLS